MPFISIIENDRKKLFELPGNRITVFGREEHVDFQILEDSLISREHFGIEKDEKGNYVLIDLGASNGTFLNDRRLDVNSIRTLKDGDKIGAGRMAFTFLASPSVEKPKNIMNQVISDMQNGKGYKTIMSEIVNEKKTKKPANL